MTFPEIHNSAELIELIDSIGFLPLWTVASEDFAPRMWWMRTAVMWCFRMAVGTGHCGSGKVRSSRKAVTCMASSLVAKRGLSVENGGPISATTVAANIRNLKKEASRRPYF